MKSAELATARSGCPQVVRYTTVSLKN